MKIFNKLLILLVIAALAGPFILKKPNGEPWLNWRDFIPNEAKQAATAMKDSIAPTAEHVMYKWQDEKGIWQYGDQPPAGANAQPVNVKTQINAMKTIELPEGFGGKTEEENVRFDPTSGSATPLSTAPLEKVPEMLEQIKDYQETLDKRNKAMEDMNR